jgi:hypothetical protein
VGEIDGSGEEQLAYYCDYIQQKYPQWWEDDAVPILWTVGEVYEFAPCLANISTLELDEHG